MAKTKRKTRPAKPILYPAEFTGTNGAVTSRDLRDCDYWDQLTPKEREWRIKFDHEYYFGRFSEKPLHKTKKLKKAVYSQKNARARCLQPKHLTTDLKKQKNDF